MNTPAEKAARDKVWGYLADFAHVEAEVTELCIAEIPLPNEGDQTHFRGRPISEKLSWLREVAFMTKPVIGEHELDVLIKRIEELLPEQALMGVSAIEPAPNGGVCLRNRDSGVALIWSAEDFARSSRHLEAIERAVKAIRLKLAAAR